MTLSTRYDDLYQRRGRGVPVAFLRALAERESSTNPKNVTGSARGLLQVTPVVLAGYNERRGTAYSADDLLDPEINVEIAADLLSRISTAFGKHPDANMRPDFSNPEFVRLLLAGWNSGYSEAAGVGCAARYLESRGQRVTHDAVFRVAADAGCTRHLQNDAKRRWQRSVADLFYVQPDAPKAGSKKAIVAAIVMVPVAILAGLLLSEVIS